MKVLFCLNHPAHYHLCINTIRNLKNDGHQVLILARKKDVLLDLLKNEDYDLVPIKKGKSIIEKLSLSRRTNQFVLDYIKEKKPDFVTGTGIFCQASKFGIPAYIMVEDDIMLNLPIFMTGVFYYTRYAGVLSPISCNNALWNKKTVKYAGYHELAYLHPNHFVPDKAVVEKYFPTSKPYFILRFAQLNAYHDVGVTGINTDIAQHLIGMLKPHGDIYITSERPLEPQFEQYRIKIDPLDMHHVMAFAQLYIGDSQTMAAESGVLGVPFVRFNGFVGKIGYLRDLEDVYQLGYGVKTNEVDRLYQVVEELLEMPDRKEVYQARRQKMLSEKIDCAQFLTWFIENYPESKRIMKENPDYQYRFR